ncbi:MAG: hypothetical protein KC609_21350, partial [Myxococcales bacterium]|nr:hypothetical protein [Myxococcales bacterium]
ADRAWREKRTIPANPSTHYGELLVFVDGDVRYMLDGFGPFRPGSAATLLLDALRAAGRIPR